MPTEFLTTQQVADRYGVRVPVVLSWIRTGQLSALNVGRAPRALRPTWRVTKEALLAFEVARRSAGAVPAERQRRRRKATDVIAFY